MSSWKEDKKPTEASKKYEEDLKNPSSEEPQLPDLSDDTIKELCILDKLKNGSL